MTIDKYISKIYSFSNDPLNANLYLSAFHFHSFFEYEGHNIPIYTYASSSGLCLLSSCTMFGLFSQFTDGVHHFSTVEQLRDFLVSNFIHIGSHGDDIYFYQNLNEVREDYGYFSVRPSPSSVGLFGFSSGTTSYSLFSGVSSQDSFAMAQSFDSLLDNRLLFPCRFDYYFFQLNSMRYDVPVDNDWGDIYNYTVLMRFFGYVLYPNCCQNFDVFPILKILGGA